MRPGTTRWIPVFCLLLAASGLAQDRVETVLLKNGTTLTGTVRLEGDHLVLERRLGTGRARHVLEFDRLDPSSLYATLVGVLSPLDAEDHRRVADAAFEAELFASAARHYRSSIEDPLVVPDSLRSKIDRADSRDLQRLVERSREALEREDFRRARDIALAALRRHPKRPESEALPKLLEEITRRNEEARLRRIALEERRLEAAAWEALVDRLDGIDRRLERALEAESRGLTDSRSFSRSKRLHLLGLKELERAGREAAALRQKGGLPPELRDRLAAAEDAVVTAQIRNRLHVASLYTIRGSYGSAIGWVNQALAFDPTDQGALAARAQVEQAAAAASASRLIR